MSETGEAIQHTVGAPGGLGRKLHGLPIWAWALLVVGGGLLVYYLYKRSTAGSVASANGTDATSALQEAAAEDSLAGGASGSTGSAASGYSSNQAYEAAAVSEYGNGANTPISVTQALDDLFAGNPLSTAEQGIINTVEGGLGAPPQSTPAINIAPSAPAASATPTITGYVKSPNANTIYQLTSDNVLHPISSWGLFQTIDPSLEYSTLDNNTISKYTVGTAAVNPAAAKTS